MKTTPFDPEFEAQLRSAIASDNEDVDLASALAPDDDPLAAPFGPKQFTRGRNRVEGFCVTPLWVVSEIAKARAYHAAPLVLVILQRMRMRRMTVVRIPPQSGKGSRPRASMSVERSSTIFNSSPACSNWRSAVEGTRDIRPS